jgi:hypothetical protein
MEKKARLKDLFDNPEFKELIEAVGKGLKQPEKVNTKFGKVIVADDIEAIVHKVEPPEPHYRQSTREEDDDLWNVKSSDFWR